MIIALLTFACTACGGSTNTANDLSEGISEDASANYTAMSTLLTNTENAYLALIDTHSEDDARDALVAQLKDRSDIVDAAVSSDGTTVWYTSTEGITYAYMTDSEFSNITLLPKSLSLNKSLSITSNNSKKVLGDESSLNEINDVQYLHVFEPFFWQQEQACLNEGGSSDACASPETFPFIDYSLISDFKKYYAEPNMPSLSYISQYLSSQATVEALRGILSINTGHHYFLFHSHGGAAQRDGKDIFFMFTYDRLNIKKIATYIDDFKAGRLTMATYRGNHYIAITPKFVDHYALDATSGSNLHIIMRSCHGNHESMRKAFLNKKRKSYSSYDGYVSRQFSYESLSEFFELLTDGLSIQDSYDSLSNIQDMHNATTQFRITTNGDRSYPFMQAFLNIGEDAFRTPPAKRLNTIDIGSGPQIMSPLVILDENNNFSEQSGILTIRWPAASSGSYEITKSGPSAQIVIFDQSSGIEWIASQECLEEEPFCACSGNIEITYSPVNDALIEGSIDAVLVNSNNVLETKIVKGQFFAQP